MAKKDISKEKNKNNFLKELKSELKKVTWPTLKKLVNNTSAVICIVLIVCAIVFVLDVCFKNLNNFGIERLKSIVSSDTEQEQGTDNTTDLNDGIDLVTDNENQEENEQQPSDGNDVVDETNIDSEGQTENNSETEVVE